MQEALEWRRVAEANGNLTRRFEETRSELEKTLRVGQACLTERGDPVELFSKHSVRRSVISPAKSLTHLLLFTHGLFFMICK